MTHAAVCDAAFEAGGDLLRQVVGALCEANVQSLEQPRKERTLPSREALATVASELPVS